MATKPSSLSPMRHTAHFGGTVRHEFLHSYRGLETPHLLAYQVLGPSYNMDDNDTVVVDKVQILFANIPAPEARSPEARSPKPEALSYH